MKYTYFVHLLNLALFITFVGLGFTGNFYIGVFGTVYCWLHLALREDLLRDSKEEFIALPSYNNPFLSILIPTVFAWYLASRIYKDIGSWISQRMKK